MEYAVDRRLCNFPGKVTANFNITNIKRVEDGLDKHHNAMLCQSFFWKFYQVRRMQFSGQIIDNLLLRLLKSENTDELWFRLGDNKVARFSLMEFLIVTGLNDGNEDEVRPNIQRSKRLLKKYFNGKTTVTPVELKSTFDACTMMEDKYKLRLVYILETMLRCKHHKTSIDVFCLDVVDNIEVFNAYPWGRRCFIDTLQAFKRIHTIKGSKTDRKYDVYGISIGCAGYQIPILDPYLVREEGHSPIAQGSPTQHRPSPSSPPPYLSNIPSPNVHQSSTAHSGLNVSEDLFERLNRQLTSMEYRITSQLMTEMRHLNKKVEQLSKKIDEVIEWVRPLHYTNTMAPRDDIGQGSD
ncbi:DUF1985 domain-containing protein [Abeliophyllum distichum]|uniref:DUF1985 domain-containing protein n=1 Tax=Abeliophyllum distichum TaxID=126358 RepID=A0ABD1VWR8_9LAMI